MVLFEVQNTAGKFHVCSFKKTEGRGKRTHGVIVTLTTLLNVSQGDILVLDLLGKLNCLQSKRRSI